ncbi:MAG: hypothetical protein QW561_03425 [Candidatus Aenigmatarchaeota archaeon]
MNVLVFYDSEIKAWLVNERIESTEEHIKNGYPELKENWQAGTLKIEVIDVPYEDVFKADLHEVRAGWVVKKRLNAG